MKSERGARERMLAVEIAQSAMRELNRDGSLANRRSDTLDAFRTHVAHGEYAGKRRFRRVWRALERPARTLEIPWAKLRARAHEALVIERNASGEPLRTRLRAHHEKDMSDGSCLLAAIARASPRHRLEARVATQGRDLCMRAQRNPGA